METLNVVANPGDQAITMTRIFNAPRELVFKAYTDPQLLAQWWGPRELTTEIDRMEVKPGGFWRFVQHNATGNEFAFHGVYHSSEAPERLVHTFEFEGMPGHVLLQTIVFEEQQGQTKLTTQMVFQSVEDRDGMLNSGMERGVRDSMERVTELLEKMMAQV